MGSLPIDRIEAATVYEQGQKYLVFRLKAPKDEVLLSYQLEMLDQNPACGLLPVEMRIKNEQVAFYYNITKVISLGEYLKRKKLASEQFLLLINSVVSTITGSASLLLDAEGFVLELPFIFVDPGQLTPYLTYLPVRSKHSFKDGLRKLICGMTGAIDNDLADAGKTQVHAVLRLLKTSDYSIDDLQRLCSGSCYEGLAAPGYSKNGKSQTGENMAGMQSYADGPGSGSENANDKVKNKILIDFNTKIAGISIKAITAGFLLQLLMLAGAVLAEGFMKSRSIPPVTRYASIGTAVVVLDLIAFKYLIPLFEKVNPHETPDTQTQIKPDTLYQNIINPMAAKPGTNPADYCMWYGGSSEKGTADDACRPDIVSDKDMYMDAVTSNQEQSNREYGETELLEQPVRVPLLVPLEDSLRTQAEVVGDAFIIGRNPGIADMILPDRVIGRAHAEITNNDGTYYILDRGSRNGTFVNGLRLAPGQKLELEDNDEIAFANIRYRFVWPADS